MSFTDDFLKAMGSESPQQSKKKKKKPIAVQSGDTFSRDFFSALEHLEEEEKKKKSVQDRVKSRAHSGASGSFDIAPTKEEDERKWFQKGLFEDGYDFGDVTKTILGTLGDVGEDIGTGIVGMGEKIVDAAAYLAPAMNVAQQSQNSLAYNFDIKKYREDQKDAAQFIQKDLYDEEKVAKKILSPILTYPTEAIIGTDVESASVFGEKADELAQSGGQLLATAGLQALGVPWWMTSGATSFGAELEGALNEGATYEEAGVSAAVSAGAEMLTEKISGGIKFGGKALDDFTTNMIARNVSNRAARTLAKLGVDMVGEGSEEVLSGVLSALGKKISYADEKKLNELFTTEEAWESFIGGAALGGVSSGIGAVKSKVKGVDSVSGLTDTEQQVVDAIYHERLKTEKKPKADIYDEVLRDLEKGYISTDRIEEILGGESRKAYDDILKESEEYNTLYRTESGKLTEEQKDRLAELKAKNKNKPYEAELRRAKDTMSQSVFAMAQDSRLAESYNERTRRGQAFSADLTQYDPQQQKVVQKAIDSGILNNTNRTHELVDFVAKISADKGVLFDFTNNTKLKESGFAVEGKQVNGFVTKDGVTLNIDSAKALETTVGHEITHVLEGSEFYDSLKDTIFEYAKAKGEYQTRFDSLSKLYENIKDADVEKELVADLVGDYLFKGSDFAAELSVKNRNVFERIFDEIKYLCKVVTAGSKEGRQLERVKREFEKAYRDSAKVQTDTKYSMTEEYSDMIDSDGEVLTKAQKQYFGNHGLKDDNGNLLKLYRSADGGRTVWDGRGSGSSAQGIYLTDDVYVARAFAANGKSVGDVLEVYANAQNPLVVDAQGSNYMDIPMPEDAPEWLEDSGDWEGRLNADKLPITAFANGHDAVIIKNVREGVGGEPATDVILRDSNQMKRTDNTRPTADPDIRYSISDSDGKQLTPEQSEYFKDSKMRDEKGNLKVMYHGTPNGDFTIFKDGTYFTDNKAYADIYQNPGASSISSGKVASNPKTFEVYLDIKKPFDISDPEARDIYINDYIKGGNAMGINPYLPDAEYAKIQAIDWTEGEDLREFLIDNEYDYDGLVLDEGATGGYGDEVKSRGKSYVVFSPEQVKSVDNQNPTDNPDIRFSLSEPVEETKDLIAVHNLHTAELLETLKLSGLPSPSVAIIKAKDGHEKYGDVSLILPKDAIDPQANKANRIYGSDAWTPTRGNAPVEYEVDYGVQRNFERTVEQLANNVANGIFSKSSVLGMAGIEGSTGMNLKEIAEKISAYDAVIAAYVAENGGNVEVVKRAKVFDNYGNDALASYIDKVGEQEAARLAVKMLTGERLTAEEIETAKDSMMESWIPKHEYALKRKPELRETRIAKYRENISDLRAEDFVRHAWEFYEDNGATSGEVDYGETGRNLQNAAERSEVAAWVTEKLQGLLSEPAIYNGKDPFTPSGKRRSFKEMHWEYTAENIVRAMNNADARGANVMNVSGEAVIATATPEYRNIDEVRADKSRLFNADKGDYEQIKDAISDELQQVTSDIVRTTGHLTDNQYDEEQTIGRVIMEAAQGTKTLSDIKQVFRKNGYRIGDAQAKSVLALFDHASKVPTGYFEAKPQRVVGFDEVGVYVIPNNADPKLKQELLNRGYSIAEYDPNVEGDRQRVVNGYEEFKFSLSDAGAAPQESGYRATIGKDIALPTEEAPVGEENAPTETVDAAELFPDDLAPMESELEALMDEEAELRSVMESYAGLNDIDAVNRLIPEHEAIRSRIQEMQQAQDERVDSLSDADAPPEPDARFPGEANDETVDNPFEDRDWYEMKSPKVKAYMYENPEVKPFFQEEAANLLYEMSLGNRAERWYNDQLHYESGGEKGFGGIKRHMPKDIEEMLDDWHMKYDDIEKGLNAIIEDNGAENIAAAKKIEFMLNRRLMNGYESFYTGKRVEPNQGYIDLLYEKQINEYSEEAFNRFMANADEYAPPAPVEEKAPEAPMEYEEVAPLFDTAPAKGTVKGQQAMWADADTAAVLDTEPKIAKKDSSVWTKFRTNFLDKGSVFEDLSLETGNRELQAKYNHTLSSESRAQWMIGNGTKGVKSLNTIREEMDKTGKTKQFYEYLYHKHNVDRMNLEDRYENVENKPVFGYSITSQMSQEQVDRFEKANPEFKKHAQDVYDYLSHLRKLMVDNGIVSQETADLWAEMYPHYVPVRRVGDEGLNVNVPLDTRKTGVNAPVKRATGGNRDILPLFDTMAMRTEQTFKAIAKNSFGVELKNTLGTTIETQKSNMDEVLDSVDNHEELLQEGKNGKNPTFTVFENGEKVTFEITEDMYDALKPKSKGLSYTNKVANTVSNLHRGLLTEYNPTFLVNNAVKDFQDILMNSQHAAKTYATIPKAINQLATKGKWFREYMENGGGQNTYFDGESHTFTEDKGLKKWFSKISEANNFIERTPRLAEYIASREAGRSIEVSMLDAARVTTNFAAGGDVTKFLNRNGATFLNASVQGAMQQVRNVREAKANGVKGWVNLATKFAIAGLPSILLNNLLWDDDEEYEELSDYVKQNYYVVAKYGDGKFIRIPKGRTLAVIQSAIQQTMNFATGEDEVDMASFLELAVNNLAPNNPVEDNILAPILQVANNETWYGDDLVPTRLQDLPAAEQYDESTDALSKWIGGKLNVSPYKVNYLLDQYSGGLGDVLLPMMTPEAESGNDTFLGNLLAPMKDKFTTDSVMNNQSVSDFYDLKDELAVTANGSGATDEDKLKSMYINAVSSELAELYQQKREIQNSDLSDAEKYAQVRDIQQDIVDLMKEGMGSYQDISYESDRTGTEYARVGERVYKWDEDGYWQKLSDEQQTKYEVTKEAGDSSYASDGTNHYRWYVKEGETQGEWRKITDDQLEKQEEVTDSLDITPEKYWSNKEEYDYAYEYPESYAVAKAVGGYEAYQQYSGDLYDIKADKDEWGKSISGSRKAKVQAYINGLDVDYHTKLILYKSEYTSYDDENYEIIDYLNGREDLGFDDIRNILVKLGFNVDKEGNIWW